jgi:hypothetical protein
MQGSFTVEFSLQSMEEVKTECNLWLCPQEKSLCTGQLLSGFKKPIALNH